MAREFPSLAARTIDDLDRAVRSIAWHFEADTVIIIGSQSILLDHPRAPVILRASVEIDAYPGNAAQWEDRHPGKLASEEINALFGIGSRFHAAFGFYIDGVDENTAKFPPGWRAGAAENNVEDDGHRIHVIAPCLEDLIVSKLHRLNPKDKVFIEASGQMQPLDIALIKARMAETSPAPEILANAFGFLDGL